MLLRPFDRFEVDAILPHFVERREITEPIDVASDEFDGVVDFSVSGETSDAEANGGVSEFVFHAKCAEHVRGLERGGGASRT